jgi:quinolinate synthase
MTLEASSAAQMYELMKPRLEKLLPDFEIKLKSEVAFEVNRLKRELNAVILGHNYMEPALFVSVPDVVGDSLKLAREAAKTDAKIIVMCGVRFMAESAKVLNPDKMVLIPSARAGCSLASSITAADVRALKAQYPGVPVITYINTRAEVQAECDSVCTSGNASKVVASFSSPQIIFVPDEYLARNVARETGKTILIPSKGDQISANEKPVLIGWHGRCEVHEKFTVEDIKNVRAQFPKVKVLAHPECSPEVVEASDYSASTSFMVQWVKEHHADQYLLLTECSMGDNIIAENPDKEVLRMCSIRCPHMNEITLEDTLAALRQKQYEVHVDEKVQRGARRALNRMLAVQ